MYWKSMFNLQGAFSQYEEAWQKNKFLRFKTKEM
jgi:hypothetical protein